MFNSTVSSTSPQAPPFHAPLPDPFTHQDPFLPSAKRHRRGSIERLGNEGVGRLHSDSQSIAWNAGVSDHRRQQSAPLNGPALSHVQSIPASNPVSSASEGGRRRSISGISSVERSGSLDTSLSHSCSSQSKMSPPSFRTPHKSQLATDKSTDEGSAYTNGQDTTREKSTTRPAGSMSISSLLGREDALPATHPRGTNPEYRHSSTYTKSSSAECAHPFLPNAISAATRTDNVHNRRPCTPDSVKHSLAISSKRKQPQSTASSAAPNTNGQASPRDMARSSGLTSQSYSPITPNASFQSNLSRENKFETHHAETPASTKPIRELVQDPSPFTERERQEYASLSGNHSKNESRYNIYDRVEKGLDMVGPQSRSLLNPSDGQQYEVQSLKVKQGNGIDYWIASEGINREDIGFTAKNELNEKSAYTPREQTVHDVLNMKSTSHNNGDKKGGLKRERSSIDSQNRAHSNDSIDFYRRSEASWLSTSQARSNQRPRNVFSDGASRRLEELPHHKVLAGITSENNKKTGRASPLPQAVQGAQAQPAGPGGNPGIKNEFGRMFSGLGSGLSSAPPNNGITSPRLSPLPQRPHDGVESAPPHSNVNSESLKLTRTGSYPGGKIRRMKGDDSFPNVSGDGRSSPLALLEQGLKRNKHTHLGHYHHHPPFSHHHHSHHRPANDESQPTIMNNSATRNPTSRFDAVSLSNVYDTSTPHHYHHRHHHHHHHHAAHLPHIHHFSGRKNYLASEESMKIPKVTILSRELRDSVQQFPRFHLGSQLYRPTLSLAPSAITPLNSKFGYRSRFRSIPLFEGKANCTFTIRVPRYYLTRDQRELICLDRNLYGTDIYSDDSDPVAAAIHCGWIRGEWPEEVDVSLFQPGSPLDRTHSCRCHSDARIGDSEMSSIMKAPPRHGPDRPRLQHDLHITLLILPPLQRYASSVRHGLKSRTWGSNHDGMSFEILDLEWVDEGDNSRGDERTGAARRERVRAAMSFMGLEERAQRALIGAAA